MVMTWRIVRDHYAVLFAAAKRAGATQASVAEAGGISGQNVISRMLWNDRGGPSVDIFLRALRGIEMDPVTFFAQVVAWESSYGEHSTDSSVSPEHAAIIAAALTEIRARGSAARTARAHRLDPASERDTPRDDPADRSSDREIA